MHGLIDFLLCQTIISNSFNRSHSALGPFGPGFRRRLDENSMQYFCLLMAL